MRIRTDDEVYRVDAVWLGPPRATMPWRARYVAWGVGVFVFLIVLTVERRLGISLFWSIAWGLVATILITRIITSKISHERPLTAVSTMWLRELTAPREATTGEGGAVSATRVRVNSVRPRKQARTRAGEKAMKRASARTGKPGRGKTTPRTRKQATKRGRGSGVRTSTQGHA